MYTIHPIPALETNYIWTIVHQPSNEALIIDPGESEPVITFLNDNKLNLTALLITHSHWDHVTGIDPLIEYHKNEGTRAPVATDKQQILPIYGPDVIRQVNIALAEGSTFKFHDLLFSTMHTPGHLPEHLSYLTHIGDSPALFCGDTIFSAGCGRIFSGTAEQLHHSLERIAELPPETKVYCAHEYTEANLRFAQQVEPKNAIAEEYLKEVKRVRAEGKPSLPSLVGIEKKVNPFLRTRETDVIASAKNYNKQLDKENPEQVFKVLRAWKDSF